MPRKARKTPEERFRFVAVKRANRTIEALRLLSHCASTKYYAYRSEDVDEIFQRIEEALSGAKSSFKEKKFHKIKF